MEICDNCLGKIFCDTTHALIGKKIVKYDNENILECNYYYLDERVE